MWESWVSQKKEVSTRFIVELKPKFALVHVVLMGVLLTCCDKVSGIVANLNNLLNLKVLQVMITFVSYLRLLNNCMRERERGSLQLITWSN